MHRALSAGKRGCLSPAEGNKPSITYLGLEIQVLSHFPLSPFLRGHSSSTTPKAPRQTHRAAPCAHRASQRGVAARLRVTKINHTETRQQKTTPAAAFWGYPVLHPAQALLCSHRHFLNSRSLTETNSKSFFKKEAPGQPQHLL